MPFNDLDFACCQHLRAGVGRAPLVASVPLMQGACARDTGPVQLTRYFMIPSFPRRPRWREVLLGAHFQALDGNSDLPSVMVLFSVDLLTFSPPSENESPLCAKTSEKDCYKMFVVSLHVFPVRFCTCGRVDLMFYFPFIPLSKVISSSGLLETFSSANSRSVCDTRGSSRYCWSYF